MALWALAKLEGAGKASEEEGLESGGGATAGALVAHLGAVVPDLSRQGLANVCWSLGRLGVHPGGDVLAKLEGKLVEEAHNLAEQDVAMCLQAFARLDHAVGDELVGAITEFLRASGSGISVRAAAHILWGYAHNESGSAPKEVVSPSPNPAVTGETETGNRKPETGNRKQETGNRRPGTVKRKQYNESRNRRP